ncbi:MAG: efflux RND transporter permease subunit [Treponema sp.]|nr:efflux RND transporter permease subunit [Treponema sp.]
MKTLTSLLQRKKASLCILAGLCAVSLFVIINSSERIKQNTGGSYVVRIKHYGINAADIEKSITIPLEDSLFSIPGVVSVKSSSENSLSNVFVQFRPARKYQSTQGRYEAVQDSAQRVYETLPSSAQRPEILSSNNSRIPVWSAAVVTDDLNNTAQILEKIVKPKLESLEGAGEVIVSGAGLKEINIIFDQEKLSILNLEPSAAAAFLGMNDSIFSGGTITYANREIIVTVDSRYPSLDNALIPVSEGRFIELSDIALITEQEREPDIYSRLNSKKTAGIAVMGSDGADLRRLSSDIKKELSNILLNIFPDQPSDMPLEFTVLTDHGAEENAAFKSVFYAALSGAVLAALVSFLLNRKKGFNYSGLFCALAIPLICMFSIAILSFGGLTLNRLLLAGIAAGTGTAIDAVILCSEKLRKCIDYSSASLSLSSITGALIAGGATTVAALIPLFAVQDSEVRIIAYSIAVVTIVSLFLSLTLLPPLLLWGIKSCKINISANKNQYFYRNFSRNVNRALAKIISICTRSSAIIITACIAITASAVLLLFIKGTDTSVYSSQDSIYAQVEFDGGLLSTEVDRILAEYSTQVMSLEGVKNIETSAKTGSGSLLVSFDPAQTKTHLVREQIKQIYIPGGFVFFHENSAKDRYWEVFVYGDDDKKCRELAEELAYLCASHPLITERVLNFKQGSKKLVFLPDREILAESNTDFYTAASRARLGVYGPVAYKRIDSNGETDVRIKTGAGTERQTKEVVTGLLVSSMRLDTLMHTREETEPSSIRRDNRRRYASITIATKPMDPRRVKDELDHVIKKMDLPPGYSIEFDPEAVKQSERLSATVLSFLLAIIFCYIIIASINESFLVPLVVLSAVPPSLAIPAIFLTLSGSAYNSAIACAFIAVSGITVNATILCVDSIRLRGKTTLSIYCALRSKLPALLSTTGTTIIAAIPFLFLAENANTLIRTLSLMGALGVAGSFICSITLIPSLVSITKKNPLVRVKN